METLENKTKKSSRIWDNGQRKNINKHCREKKNTEEEIEQFKETSELKNMSCQTQKCQC